jgi:HAD superfamily hydrolase (TIGR01509 family)
MSTATNDEKYKALCELTRGNYKGFLYDCDGTLADNMQAHKETYLKVAASQGVKINAEIVDEFAGYPIPLVVEQINKRYNVHFNPLEFERLKEEMFYNEFIPHTKPISFVVEHLKANAGKLKIGVVSGGARHVVQKTLEQLGIASLVQVLVCAGETERGKPYPDPFLAAAQKLGVLPNECMVFEDGDAGIKAAEAAGMKWIRIDKV